MKKDVIYVDNDDEITSITDKINSSKETLVALVLPKRCTVLQSSVNMKILQRITSDAGKNVVLITSESSLLPLAGTAGLYVAKSLQSKPVIPPTPDTDEKIDTINEADDNPDIDPSKPIGELAGVTAGAAAVAAVASDDDKPIELGEEPTGVDKKATDKKPKKDKKDKKLAVPNFNTFRTRMFLAIGGVILLIVLWYVGFVVMPRAKVEVVTENRSVPVTLSVTANPTISSVDEASNAVPAEVKTSEQTVTKKFTATGEKNTGEKATGTVSIFNCNSEDRFNSTVRTVPAGTGISSGGSTFITQKSVDVSPSKINFNGTNCQKDVPAAVTVIAQNPGDSYNLSPRSYSVAGFSSMSATDSSGMSGGTNKNVKIVSQSDCDAAKNEASSTKIDDYKNQLVAQMQAAGLTPIKETFTSNVGSASCSPAVGQEANEATASVQLKMSMLGVNTAGLDQLIKVEATKQIEGSQSVIDTGSKTAIFAVKETKNNGLVVLNVTADTQVGIKQDANYISKSITGKKRGQSVDIIKAQPGVSGAKISYSPFWVTKTPKNVKHITVKFTDNGATK
jgi:hypothetical protein